VNTVELRIAQRLSSLRLSDLDGIAVHELLQLRGQDHPDALEVLALTRQGVPTLAGLLVLGKEPQRSLPFAQINAAVFRGTDTSFRPVIVEELKGRLFDVVDQAERFLDLHLLTPHRIQGFEPEPRPELPKEVLREAVVNAVAHRDYTIRGPVRLFVLDDRIEIHTPGKPPNGVDAESMRAGVHVVRNPAIYARLSDAGLVTRAGTGIRRIVRLVREATGKDIDLRVSPAEVVLVIPRPSQEQQHHP
jgi:ATP-dependent DNA helicase RecG